VIIKLFYSVKVKVNGAFVKFFLIKGQDIDLANTLDTFEKFIYLPNNPHENFTITFPNGEISFSPSPDNQLQFHANASEGLLSHSNHLKMKSVAKNISLLVLIPLAPNKMKNLCNWTF